MRRSFPIPPTTGLDAARAAVAESPSSRGHLDRAAKHGAPRALFHRIVVRVEAT